MDQKNCPNQVELKRFVECQLDIDQAELVADHLSHCVVCDDTVSNLEKTMAETFAKSRATNESREFEQEPECQNLLNFAYRIDFVSKYDSHRDLLASSAETDFGDYRLLQKIGAGGMGTVYKAIHMRLNKVVALKVLPMDRFMNPRIVQRFKREMIAIGTLDHSNIVRATDAGEHDGRHFLVMEYIDGIDLGQLVQNIGVLPVAAACAIICEVAQGLQHAHDHGLIHRDIKPRNIMLTKRGEVKILDLGLARFVEQATDSDREVTTTGQVMGSIDYMAPEQGDETQVVDIRADIYAMGATLYKLLTGSTPLSNGNQSRSVMQKLSALVTQTPPCVREKRPEVAPKLASLVSSLLAKDPSERPPTATAVRDLLTPFAINADVRQLINAPLADASNDLSFPRTSARESAPNHQTISPTASVSGDRNRMKIFVSIAAGLAAAAILFGLFTFETPKGLVEIELAEGVEAESVTIGLMKNGKEVEIADKSHGWLVQIKNGEYDVKLLDSTDKFEVSENTITVSRDNRAIVHVRRKQSTNNKAQPDQSTLGNDVSGESIANSSVKTVDHPFHLIRDGLETQSFKTLFAAIEQSCASDVIEVWSGHTILVPVTDDVNKPIHIRAEKGFRPTLQFVSDESWHQWTGDVTIEGCDLDFRESRLIAHGQSENLSRALWRFSGCRIWGQLPLSMPRLIARNSIFIENGKTVLAAGTTFGSEYEFDNCLLWHCYSFFSYEGNVIHSLKLTDCSCVASGPQTNGFVRCSEGAQLEVESSGCLFSGITTSTAPTSKVLWKGRQNYYAGVNFDWQQWPKDVQVSSILDNQDCVSTPSVAQLELQKLDLASHPEKVRAVRQQIDSWATKSAEVFALTQFDWDKIGPGEGYVNALRSNGSRAVETLRPERLPEGAFVLIRNDLPIRGYATIAACIDAAEDGDIIEIRTDEQVPQLSIDGKGRSLTIRAAVGYSPVLQGLGTKHTKLSLEGLTINSLLRSDVLPADGSITDDSKLYGFVKLMNCATAPSADLTVLGIWQSDLDLPLQCVNCVFGKTHFELKPRQALSIKNSLLASCWISGSKEPASPSHVNISTSIFWTADSSLRGNVGWDNAVRVDSSNSFFVSSLHLTQHYDADPECWKGRHNVFAMPVGIIPSADTLARFKSIAATETGSVELSPLQFDPIQWKPNANRMPDYRKRLNDKEFGADVERIIDPVGTQ